MRPPELALSAWTEQQPAPFLPGEAFAYSNTNYTLAGEILSAVHERNWREVVSEQVFAASGCGRASKTAEI